MNASSRLFPVRKWTCLIAACLVAGSTATGAFAQAVVNRNAAGQVVETYAEVDGKRHGG